MSIGYEWHWGTSLLTNSAELLFRSGDLRITSRGIFTTPFSFHAHLTQSPYSCLQLAVDQHHRFLLSFRFDYPADRYYGPQQVVLNRHQAELFADFQLTHFSWSADGTGRLTVRCVPGIVGGACYHLAGIGPEDGQTLTSLIEQLKQPQSPWRNWL